jgi:type III secretory pathway component EscU
MTVHGVLALLNGIVDQLEDLSIERDALASILVKAKFSRDEITRVWEDAKSDPEVRSKARLAFADLRGKLQAAGKSSAFEVLAKDTSTSQKPS